jgi:hypothetical protein
MKLEVPIKVDIDDVTELIHDLQCLQTYKLGVNETTVLVSLDAVVGVFADHIRAKRLGKDIDVHSKEEAIPVDWLLRKAEWCDKNNGIFVSGAIRSAVDAWREEQNNGIDKS